MDADYVVIGSPFYNFGISSALKAWIDHIVRAGVTFRYDQNGPEGLVKGKKVYVAMASGGVYTEGPMQSYDFNGPYLEKNARLFGNDGFKNLPRRGPKSPGVNGKCFWIKLLQVLVYKYLFHRVSFKDPVELKTIIINPAPAGIVPTNSSHLT